MDSVAYMQNKIKKQKHKKEQKMMKKLATAFAMCGALVLGACDSGAQKGDTVVIDFAGYLNGELFAGGTAQDFPLVLGSGQFVPGFEDQLIGAKEGEVREVKITFPEQYVPGLAGKDVIFKVTVTDINPEPAAPVAAQPETPAAE